MSDEAQSVNQQSETSRMRNGVTIAVPAEKPDLRLLLVASVVAWLAIGYALTALL